MTTTKDHCLFFKHKQDLAVNDISNDQFINLNLNQNNNQCFAEIVPSSKNLQIHKKEISNYALLDYFRNNNDLQIKQNSTLFEKSKLVSSSFASLNAQKDYCKNEDSKEGKPLNSNNSTLSLHISAYENLIDAISGDPINGEKNGTKLNKESVSSIKSWKAVKEIFNGSSSGVNYAFEFPRQQKKQNHDPEVMQFKASQRLSNFNGAPSIDVTRQIPFEINPAFFPPPTIPIPINEIKAPVEFNYDFKTEHEAVIRYKKEQESVESGSGDNKAASNQTTIDIISKLSYLPISGSSKPKVQKEESIQIQEKPLPSQQQQNTIDPSPVIQASLVPSSINSQPQQNIQGSARSLTSQQQPQHQQNIQTSSTLPVSSSTVPIPGASSSSYAAGLLPTWTPPQLTLDDFLK